MAEFLSISLAKVPIPIRKRAFEACFLLTRVQIRPLDAASNFLHFELMPLLVAMEWQWLRAHVVGCRFYATSTVGTLAIALAFALIVTSP